MQSFFHRCNHKKFFAALKMIMPEMAQAMLILQVKICWFAKSAGKK